MGGCFAYFMYFTSTCLFRCGKTWHWRVFSFREKTSNQSYVWMGQAFIWLYMKQSMNWPCFATVIYFINWNVLKSTWRLLEYIWENFEFGEKVLQIVSYLKLVSNSSYQIMCPQVVYITLHTLIRYSNGPPSNCKKNLDNVAIATYNIPF